jgi:hypothetical protein
MMNLIIFNQTQHRKSDIKQIHQNTARFVPINLRICTKNHTASTDFEETDQLKNKKTKRHLTNATMKHLHIATSSQNTVVKRVMFYNNIDVLRVVIVTASFFR